jgi:hypothetical protein
VDQDIETQRRDDSAGVNLGRWIVPDGRNIDDAVKETWPVEELVECGKRGRPTALRIVLRAFWLCPKRAEQEHVVETDDMLQNALGVPVTAW